TRARQFKERSFMNVRTRIAAVAAAAAIAAAGCSSGASPSASVGGPAGSGGGGISATSFDAAFTAMAQLTSVHSAGTGIVGVILPDTTSSARYTSYDLPYLKQAFKGARYAD